MQVTTGITGHPTAKRVRRAESFYGRPMRPYSLPYDRYSAFQTPILRIVGDHGQ